jgi:purine-nucleoside phosphorylase
MHAPTPLIDLLRARGFQRPDAAIVLGSGYSWFTERMEETLSVPYGELPGLPSATIKGHAGVLVQGRMEGRRILVFSGRFHHYEGYPYEHVTLPVRIAADLGAERLILTNAAGGIRESFRVGDLMWIQSLIRLNHAAGTTARDTFRMPEHGGFGLDQPGGQGGQEMAVRAARAGIRLETGTYLYVKGPSYETPAEIRAFRMMGADAVGMSTVPELAEAGRLGLPVMAFSLITNAAAGMGDEKLSHEDIASVAARSRQNVEGLIRMLLNHDHDV